jgi:SH3 domain-containing YSC84-like protein 1
VYAVRLGYPPAGPRPGDGETEPALPTEEETRFQHGQDGEGAGFGFQVGAEVTEYVMVLNTDEAVKAFSRGGNVTLGGDVSVAAGPVGRTAAAAVTPVAAVYSYNRSQGLFAGVSVTGTVIVTRDGANKEYYGRKVTPAEILSGHVNPPASAHKLQEEPAKF